jgi:hypothetical protein
VPGSWSAVVVGQQGVARELFDGVAALDDRAAVEAELGVAEQVA